MAQEAKTRLTRMLVAAVGLVDRPANLRPFLKLKSAPMPDPIADNGAAGITPGADGAQPDNGPPPDVGPKPLVMPGAVKQGLSDGLAAILATVTAVAEMINGATADDSAEIPVEPLFKLDEAAAQLDALADQWIMEEEAPEQSSMGAATMASSPKPGEEQPAQKAAPKKAKVETPRRKTLLIAKKRLGAMKEIHKAMGECHKALGDCHKGLDGVITEAAGEAKPPKTEPEKPAKKSVTDEVNEALAPLLGAIKGLEGKVAGVEASLAAATKAAPAAAPAGNRQIEEGHGAPPAPQREPTFKEMLAAGKKKQG